MKRIVPALLLPLCALMGLAASGAALPAAQPLPTPFPLARYQTMSAKSPFAVATATAAVGAPTPGFASQLYIDGVASVGNSDFVAIKSRDPDKANVIYIEVGKSTDDGMKVERIHWSTEMGKSTVDVSKGAEKATLAFDEAQMAKTTDAVSALPPGPRLPVLAGRAGLQFQRPVAPQPPGLPADQMMQNNIQMRRRQIIRSGP